VTFILNPVSLQIEMAKKEGTSTRTTTTSIWRRAQGAVVTLIAAPLT